MTTNVKAHCNWTQTGGCDFSKSITIRCSEEDVFVKPQLDDVLSDDHAILLNKPENSTDACEVHVQIFPRFKIAAVTLICTASKLELFLGIHKEYIETLYGEIIEGDDENDVANETDLAIPPSYRYDIEIERSGVVELSLRLVTGSEEICLYGIMLHIAPNPNGITTLLPKAVNLDNVQEMLKSSNQKLSSKAEKCKQFVEIFRSSQTRPSCQTAIVSDEQLEALKELKLDSNTLSVLESNLKTHIDAKLLDVERNITTRLDAFEAQQAAKLDKILQILENNH